MKKMLSLGVASLFIAMTAMTLFGSPGRGWNRSATNNTVPGNRGHSDEH